MRFLVRFTGELFTYIVRGLTVEDLERLVNLFSSGKLGFSDDMGQVILYSAYGAPLHASESFMEKLGKLDSELGKGEPESSTTVPVSDPIALFLAGLHISVSIKEDKGEALDEASLFVDQEQAEMDDAPLDFDNDYLHELEEMDDDVKKNADRAYERYLMDGPYPEEALAGLSRISYETREGFEILVVPHFSGGERRTWRSFLSPGE